MQLLNYNIQQLEIHYVVDFNIIYDKMNLPNPVMPMAILPKAKG